MKSKYSSFCIHTLNLTTMFTLYTEGAVYMSFNMLNVKLQNSIKYPFLFTFALNRITREPMTGCPRQGEASCCEGGSR